MSSCTYHRPWIVFEGTNGSGKSTHLALISEYLSGRGIDLIQTREPGGTVEGRKIRENLLRADGRLTISQRTDLFLEDRRLHLQQVVAPAIKRGTTILQDRCGMSTVVFQSNDYSHPQERIAAPVALRQVNLFTHIRALGKPVLPGLILLFDCSIEEALCRVSKRDKGDFYDSKPTEYHQRIRESYLHEATQKHHAGRVVVISTTGRTIDEVHIEVRQLLDEHFLQVR